ncbi:MAG: ketoacyl-ACP synthase III [Patescibacteria group bacterium]
MHQPYGMRIVGISAYAPPTIVTNDEIARRLHAERDKVERHRQAIGAPAMTDDEQAAFDTNDRWIRRYIGFSERRFSGPNEGSIDLALRASQRLLTGLHRSPRDIDGIVFASVTPSFRHSPPDAALLQEALGIPAWVDGRPREILGLDVALACCSWMAGLQTAYRHLADAERILLIGADRMSATINWRDRSFACVLGDAGTATLCERVDPADDWFGDNRFFGWIDGSKAMVIHTPVGGSRRPDLAPSDMESYRHCLTMDGRQVREDMVPFVSGPAMDAMLAKAGLALDQLDLQVWHEANLVMNREVERRLRERGFRGTTLDAGGRFGNTTSASIPLALALNGVELKPGRTVALVGYGGGYSYRSAIATIRHPISTFVDM